MTPTVAADPALHAKFESTTLAGRAHFECALNDCPPRMGGQISDLWGERFQLLLIFQ
jgi:hypothetical protein